MLFLKKTNAEDGQFFHSATVRFLNSAALWLWSFFPYLFACILIAPFLFVLINSFESTSPTTQRILSSFLGEYAKNTGIILLITLFNCLVLGFISAYIISFYNFARKKIFEFLVIVPFAIPSYVLGYIYTDFFSYGGILYKIFQLFGIFFHLDIMNLDRNILDCAESLGAGKLKLIFKIIIPISYPAISAAAILITMEVLNAFGVPSFFGVQVFSTGIYQAWVSYQDMDAAIKLSFMLLFFLALFSIFIYITKNAKKYQYSTGTVKFIKQKTLKGKHLFIIYAFFITLIGISFIIPCIHLIIWLYHGFENIDFIPVSFFFTLFIGIVSAFIIVVVSLVLVNHTRFKTNKIHKIIFRIATIGYGIPGIIIAIAVLLVFIKIDGIFSTGLPLTLSILPLIVAYVIRFIMLSFNSIDAGFNKIGLQFSKASSSLGAGKLKTLLLVDIPLIKSNIIAGFLLSFIEIIKDLPITLLLIPFNYETLAITISKYSAQERIVDIGFPALLIVIISTALLYLFTRIQKK